MINKVLIPRIEYLCRHFFILSHISNQFNQILRSIFRSSLSLPKNLYNSILYHPIYPNILNIFNDHQIRVQASLINAQFNSRLTSLLMKFLILDPQNKFWSPDLRNTLSFFSFPLKSFSRIETLMCIFKHYSLTFNFNFSFSIKGGRYPLCDYLVDPKKIFLHNKLKKQRYYVFRPNNFFRWTLLSSIRRLYV